jgi:hypothetical protein
MHAVAMGHNLFSVLRDTFILKANENGYLVHISYSYSPVKIYKMGLGMTTQGWKCYHKLQNTTECFSGNCRNSVQYKTRNKTVLFITWLNMGKIRPYLYSLGHVCVNSCAVFQYNMQQLKNLLWNLTLANKAIF